MVLHVAKGSFSDDVAHISFPTEVDKVRNEVIAVEEFGSWAPAYVIGGDGAAKVPASYIERDALFSEAGVQKLNQLAGLVDTMDLEAQKVFAGALMVEHAKCLDDVLRVAGSLDSYELFPDIKTDEELGRFLVDTGPITGKFVFAEEAKPYLDYAKIGAEQRKQLGGTHTEQGFVKRREVVQTQKEAGRPAFALTLVSPTGTCCLDLPASDDTLEQTKKSAGAGRSGQRRHPGCGDRLSLGPPAAHGLHHCGGCQHPGRMRPGHVKAGTEDVGRGPGGGRTALLL